MFQRKPQHQHWRNLKSCFSPSTWCPSHDSTQAHLTYKKHYHLSNCYVQITLVQCYKTDMQTLHMYKLTKILSAARCYTCIARDILHYMRNAQNYRPFWLCMPCILNSLSLLSHHTYHMPALIRQIQLIHGTYQPSKEFRCSPARRCWSFLWWFLILNNLLHQYQVHGSSPLCTCWCVFKLLVTKRLTTQIPGIWAYPSMYMMTSYRIIFVMNDNLHTSQLYGCFTMCITLMCLQNPHTTVLLLTYITQICLLPCKYLLMCLKIKPIINLYPTAHRVWCIHLTCSRYESNRPGAQWPFKCAVRACRGLEL
jgi:hypothetical protein